MEKRIKSLIIGNVFFTAAVLTIIPWQGASENNLMGYKSLCIRAPVSSFICLAGALIQIIRIGKSRK